MAPSSKSSSVIPRTSKPAGSVESRCLEYRSDQLSVPFWRKIRKAKDIYLLKRKAANIYLLIKEKGCPPISSHRDIYVPVSVYQSIKFNAIKLVLTLLKIHLTPCQTGCLWERWSNANIHQEQMYSGNWLLLLRARLTQLKSLDRSTFDC